MGKHQDIKLVPIAFRKHKVVCLRVCRQRTSQRDTWLSIPVDSIKFFCGTNANIENILQLVVSPNYLFLVSISFGKKKAKLIETVRKILPFINQNQIVKWLNPATCHKILTDVIKRVLVHGFVLSRQSKVYG